MLNFAGSHFSKNSATISKSPFLRYRQSSVIANGHFHRANAKQELEDKTTLSPDATGIAGI